MLHPAPEFGQVELGEALEWVRARTDVDWYDTPLAVVDAVDLLAAIFTDDPLASQDEARVPNLIRLQLFPWMR